VRIEVADDVCYLPLLEGTAITVTDPSREEEPPAPDENE
jgi:hypothetical protein